MIIIKPIIGIVGRLYEGEENVCCVEEVRLAVTKMGAIPLLILPVDKVRINLYKPTDIPLYTKEEILDIHKILDLCDGFILPGGNTWYQIDEEVINYALEKDKPLLAICLGMQVLSKILSGDKNIACDTTLKNDTFIAHFDPYKDYVHDVIIDKNSILYSIVGEEMISVNSRHNYHVRENTNLFVSARSFDNLIEAVEDKTKKFIVGIQWHPESILDKDLYAKKIFKAFRRNF